MSDYTQVENYDCPQCDWSLHVDMAVWNRFDDHQSILEYIQEQVIGHAKTHGVQKSIPLFPVSKDIQLYKNCPYLYHSPINKESRLFAII